MPGNGANDAKKNILKPWLRQMWCIPGAPSGDYVCAMEDVLDVYHRPYDPCNPVVCMDETTKQLIAEVNGPLDVALLPIGDNFTMGVDDAVKATDLLSARMNIPMHYDTFDVVKADAVDFVSKVEARGGQARVIRPGERFELD